MIRGIEYELVLIGHALKHAKYPIEILEGLEASDFSSPWSQAIYRAISDNIGKYDPLILQNALKSQGSEILLSELIELENQAFEGIDLSHCKEQIRKASRPIRLNDLKGCSGLKEIPDNVLSIWRPRGEDDSTNPQGEIVLYVLKVRDDSGDEDKVILTFDKRSQSYADSGHGGASPPEGKGISHSSSTVRPGRDWSSGYDQ